MLKTTVLLFICALTAAAPTTSERPSLSRARPAPPAAPRPAPPARSPPLVRDPPPPAPPEGVELSDTVPKTTDHKRELSTTVSKLKKQGKTFKADVEIAGDENSGITSTTEFDAAVEAYLVKEGEDGYKPAQVQWRVKINSDVAPTITRALKCTTSGGCANGAALDQVKDVPGLQCKKYNWHIHAKKVGENNECGGSFTGGHADANLACGPASEYKATTCTALAGGTWVAGYGGRCNGGEADGSSAQNKCEYGDLSGKMGKVPIGKGKTYYIDNFLQPLDTYDATSVVFHCCVSSGEYNNGDLDCGARVACGDFD